MMARTYFFMITYLVAHSYAGRRGALKSSKESRDTASLSYSSYRDEYRDAYRRAAALNTMPHVDTCYDSERKARKCIVTKFGNVARSAAEAISTATSTCGNPPSQFCSQALDIYGRKLNQCSVCDANHKSRMHPSHYVIDGQTNSCWISEPIHEPTAMSNITVSVSLGKKYDLTFVKLNFCNKIPESMALYKSADFGRTWIPLQYFSSQCEKIYGVPTNRVITKANEQEAVCNNEYSSSQASDRPQVVFSLMDGRPSAHNFDNSFVLRDWVTITDFKVVFNRFTAPGSAVSGANHIYYSMSEMTLAGRCKCYGHASQCILNELGQTVCDCKHNTAGPDCERCKPFYYDRPWNPATSEDANECKACECNLHSSRCIFNRELYASSGRRTGGVCINCKHNTAGVNCQHCVEGFYRDMNKPMSHRYACQACQCNQHSKKCRFSPKLYQSSARTSGGVCIDCRHNTMGSRCHYCKDGYYRDVRKSLNSRRACKACGCHPHGSVDSTCSPTGHCFCKEGVTGKKCDDCKAGYIMGKNPKSPCEKIPRPADHPISAPQGSQTCNDCRVESVRMNPGKYCYSDFAMKALVTRREKAGKGWVRFNVNILGVYNKDDRSKRNRVRRGEQYVYVREIDLHCKCPKLRVNKEYLMTGVKKSDKDGLMLNRDSIVVQYKRDYERRFKKFLKKGKKQAC